MNGTNQGFNPKLRTINKWLLLAQSVMYTRAKPPIKIAILPIKPNIVLK